MSRLFIVGGKKEMNLSEIRETLTNFKKADTRFNIALEEGELLETYVKAVIGKDWSDKLSIKHPSGYDFFWSSDDPFRPSYYIDIKASKHSKYNGTCFVEYIQNHQHNKNGKANHYSGALEDGIDYFLLYVDTTPEHFGEATLFNVRKLRQHYSNESALIPGGWKALGFRVTSSDRNVARTFKLPEPS
jgi:hypothetical protein